MHVLIRNLHIALAMMIGSAAGPALAKLLPLTPEQEQAAAAKKAQSQAQQEKEKQELAAAMERVSARWRARAAENGWQTHSPVPTATPAAGSNTAAQTGGRPETTPSSVPRVPVPSAAIIRSEKLGTAPPSADVKNPAEKGK